MRTIISPGQLAAMARCFCLVGPHEHGIANITGGSMMWPTLKADRKDSRKMTGNLGGHYCNTNLGNGPPWTMSCKFITRGCERARKMWNCQLRRVHVKNL